MWITLTMPLHQLCGAVSAKRSSNSSDFTQPAINAQEICDAKVHSAPRPMERCPSQTSTLSFGRDICRICHSEDEEDLPLITPCYCSGSLRYVHQTCLQQWIKSSNTKICELCKFVFIMNSKVKPFSKWERLELSSVERRKILCSVTFHVITITFVIFSLNVLIQRTSQEVQDGSLEWPFWTKVIVVAIAFTGSIVFVYVQCKMYIQLCRRWRAFNRVIYVQNAPEKMPLDQHYKGDHLYNDSLNVGFKDVGDSEAVLSDREKSPMSISFISNDSPRRDPGCVLSSVTTSGGGLSSSKASLQGCPPGVVEWHEGSTSPALAQSFNRNCELVKHENELQSLVSLTVRSPPNFTTSSEHRLSSLSASKIYQGGDAPRNAAAESIADRFTEIETRFVHTPSEHLRLETLADDLRDLETLDLETH